MKDVNKMNYYAMFTDQSGKDGIPVFFEARMFEQPIAGNAFSKENSIYYNWMKPGFNEYELLPEYYLYTKCVDLEFDYYKFANHYIISEDFLAVISKYNVAYTKGKVHVFSAEDNRELALRKSYFFVKFDYAENLIDYMNSIYEVSLSDKGEPIVHNGVRYIRKYEKIELIDENICSEVFLIKDPILGFNLFCTDQFKIDAENMKVYALMFVALPDYLDFVKYSGFLGKETYERLKKRDIPGII